MPEPARSLPTRPSLEQQKKLARELLEAFHAGDVAARDRIRRQLPDRERITLADAQFTLAREYGFESWAKLKLHIEQAAPPVTDEQAVAQFRRAIHTRDAGAARALLQRHANVRAVIDEPLFSFGGTALTHIAGDSDAAIVDVLLEFGADPNRRSDWSLGPWHALHSARGAVAERLLAAGAVPDACAAAHLDRPDLLRRILAADPTRVHERGGDGQTPLHFAASREVVDLLLDHGADLDARDLDHRGTPAQWMLEGKRNAGRYELARYLVERGATADIFLAAALGLTTRLRALLEADPALRTLRTHHGAYGEQPPSSYHIYTWTIGQNLTPLQVAARFERPDAVAVLRSFASRKELFLDACAEPREAEAKQLLRDHPALLGELTPDDLRALPDAGWGPNAAAVALMLELGFDPATHAHNGGNVLHCAAWEGSVPCIEIALRYPAVRALIDRRDTVYGGTPLNWCCHGSVNCGNPAADHPTVARLLLEAGASPDIDVGDAAPQVQAVVREYAQKR
jgi:ankyrin repeat protein